MDSVYRDTSVVVACYISEPTSRRVQSLYESTTTPVISNLVDLEVVAAVALRQRIGDLGLEEARQVLNLFDQHLEAGLSTRMHLQPDHYRWARNAIARFDLPLKSPDALHLAAAQVADLTLITADRQLARNAEALNLVCQLIEP